MGAMIARAGIVLAVLQFAFALTWVVYAAYLPALAAQVGISKSMVPWILLADQVIFVICDWLAGVLADRIDGAVARLGRWIALVTVASCAAFLALPLVAPSGSAAALTVLVLVWSATSSVLRAPTLVLAARHASPPQRAWLASLYSLGLAAAGAVGPYLGRALSATDPRLPFAIASCLVAVLTLALAALPRRAPARTDAGAEPRTPAAFVVALALLAIGLQVHTSIRSSALYLRFASPAELTDLMPVFWIAASVASLPAGLVLRRAGGLPIMATAAAVGAIAVAVAELAGALAPLVVAQAVAGLAWGCIVSGALAAATAFGRRAGSVTGLVFSMLAAATVARIALVAGGAAAAPAAQGVLPLVAPVGWALATLVAGALARRRR